MESGQYDDSIKETDTRPDDTAAGSGCTRFYECTFCKQGFNTAQALGGHMNIHRKERARIRQPQVPSVSIPIQPTEEHTRPPHGGFSSWPISSSYSQPAKDHSPSNYHMYLPPSSSSPKVRKPRSLSLFQEDQSTNLRLGTGYAEEEEKRQHEEEDEVDLELRLGHDP